ncbi:MAG: hypothetical protein NT075_31745 [Chloroflexi bacterium]|nr:hypothetical protein [Chloroflexota bacterium]
MIVVVTFMDVGTLILTESVLSFLDLGIQPPTATWGNMINWAWDFFFTVAPVTHKNIALPIY